MKKNLILFITVIVSFFGCTEKNPVEELGDYSSEIEAIVNNAWNNFAEGKENLPGGIAMQVISSKGEYYVGTGELKASENSIHFRGASVTKTYTAAAMLLLQQQKKLSLNHLLTDTIPTTSITYLPNTDDFNVPYKDRITLKMMLQHRAGLWDLSNQIIPDSSNAEYAGMKYWDWAFEQFGQTHTFKTEEILSVISENNLYQFQPGKDFHYSNTGFIISSYIIERISGLRFDEFIKQNFLTPNNLNNTTFPHLGTDLGLPEPYASSYMYFKGQHRIFNENNVTNGIGGGNIITTPYDLASWIRLLLSGNVGVDKSYIDFVMMDCTPTYDDHQNYGLGLVYTPGIGFGHNGGFSGNFTVTRYDPELDFAVAMFISVWDIETFDINMMEETYILYEIIRETKELMYE